MRFIIRYGIMIEEKWSQIRRADCAWFLTWKIEFNFKHIYYLQLKKLQQKFKNL